MIAKNKNYNSLVSMTLKKIKIIYLILIILSILFGEKEFIKESYNIVIKANQLKPKYWGIKHYSDFIWFFSKRNEQQYLAIDFKSIEFEKYLQDQYKMFRLQKSAVFLEIMQICQDILKYQMKNQDILTGVAKHAAMAVITTLNSNIIGINKMNAQQVERSFYENYGVTEIVPMNIFQILIEKNIIFSYENVYCYTDVSAFYYYFYTSKQMMPIISENPKDILFEISNPIMNCILDEIALESDLSEFEEFKQDEEYNTFEKLITDKSNVGQYYEFKNQKIKLKYLEIMEKNIILNDKLFQSLHINRTGLGYYYYNHETKIDNCINNVIFEKINK